MEENHTPAKVTCEICHRQLDPADLAGHMQIFHPNRDEQKPPVIAPVVIPKAVNWAKAPDHGNRFKHNVTLKEQKIKESALPSAIKLRILQLDIYKTQINSPELFEASRAESARISETIVKWKNRGFSAEAAGIGNIQPTAILDLGDKLLQLVERVKPTTLTAEAERLMTGLLRPHGFIHQAKAFSCFILHPVSRKQFDNNIELIEKIAKQKKALIDKIPLVEPVPEPFVSPVQEELKKQYEELLKKNMAQVVAHVEREKAKMMQAVREYLELQTTSVFTYKYKSGQIIGSIEDIAVMKVPFKI